MDNLLLLKEFAQFAINHALNAPDSLNAVFVQLISTSQETNAFKNVQLDYMVISLLRHALHVTNLY